MKKYNRNNVWEREYKNPKLITKSSEPQKFFLRFLKYLKKNEGFKIKNSRILDLGSGTGRNANYLAGLGAKVVGMEISKTAVKVAEERASAMGVSPEYIIHNIGEKYPFNDNFFNLVLDITSSNSLDEKEREIYLNESYRVLKKRGWMFVRALSKEGDKNAKRLLKKNPGTEYDTYIIPKIGLAERVFSKKDFINYYSKKFKILLIIKETGYAVLKNQKYKRNYWVAYLKKS